MPKLILSAYRARRTTTGFAQINLSLGATPPHPTETVNVKTSADCEMYLRDYAARAETYGIGMYCTSRIAKGDRAPRGYKDCMTEIYICLDREPAVA